MDEKAHRLQLLQHQQARLGRRLAALQQRGDQLSRWRLILFVGAFVLGGVAFLQWGPVVWLVSTAVLLIPFIISVIIHRGVDTAVTRFTLWQQMKQTDVARMSLDWTAMPAAKSFPVPADHPFAVDIDLVGEFSIHRLLDTAVSQEGSERLHQWLLEAKPEREQVLARQQLVRELASQTPFRQRLWLQASLAIGEEDSGQWAGQALLDWLQKDAGGRSLRPLLIGLSALAVVNWLLFAGTQFWGWPPLWIGSILLYGALFMTLGFQRTETLFSDVLFLTDRLRVLNRVFAFLERWRFGKMPHTAQLCDSFLVAEERPSTHIQNVQRVVAGVGLRQNWLLGFVFNVLVPWDVYFAYRLDQCRADLAVRLPRWLDIWFELEAASSLATFAWLNVGECAWPALADVPSPELTATSLGHPLIASPQRVCNDLHLDAQQSIYLITGSNMAGKSSFLRTIGVNLALAYAGGPVVAQTFRASWLRLFATIRVADSLNDGFSFFYAEVRRLSQLLTALNDEGERPLLFLIDEIFRGTNNRERLIGSRAYIQALAQGNGLGTIATHDLELVQLAETAAKLTNVHFRDDVVDGRMVFDYKLHPGPCPTTNALKIMALAGLPIEPQS
ncbi:MutS family DNA mismatch repair protein [Candidatus Leptofilum sp.]|uniref:MutS family DNA mismatch repair protein n=1 Tax=Candidatus Leptofilum sp. TaxID=3241576 RepID=UPI003B5B4A27